MNNQTSKPYTNNRSRRSLRLFAMMVAGSAAGIQGNGTAADAEHHSCDGYKDPGTGWPLADDVPVPCGRLPNVLLLEHLPSKAEIQSHNPWQVKAPSTYGVVQALNDGSASIYKRRLPLYQTMDGHQLLIGGKVEQQGFAIDHIKRTVGPISGQFFNTAMVQDADGQIAFRKTLQLKLDDRSWQITTICDHLDASDTRRLVIACRLQSEIEGASQALMHWGWQQNHGIDVTADHFSVRIQHDVYPTVVFAGDIDGDRKLDLLLRTSAHREAKCTYWHLLSEQRDGKLVLAASTVA